MTGAALLIKRTVVETIGFLDPAFFLGVEHTDLCIRAHRSGFKIVYVPEGKVWHKVATSINKLTDYPQSLRLTTSARGIFGINNKIKLYGKHSRIPPFIVPVVLLVLLVLPAVVLRFLLIRKEFGYVLRYGVNYLGRVLRYYVWLKWKP